MSDPSSKSSHEPTHLAQDHENQENASAQEPPPPYNPPPAYTETKEVPPPNMTPPPEYNETPSSSMNLCYTNYYTGWRKKCSTLSFFHEFWTQKLFS
jgi:hypothetical protein